MSVLFTIFQVFFSIKWRTTLFNIQYLLRKTRFLYKSTLLWPFLLYLSFPYAMCYSILLLFSLLFTNLDDFWISVYLVPGYSAIVMLSHHCTILLTNQLLSILNIPIMIDKTNMILYVFSIDTNTRILIEKE